jgi:hypothetical protein
MKICPTCEKQFPNGFQYCPNDTELLLTAEEHLRQRRQSPRCQRSRSDRKAPPPATELLTDLVSPAPAVAPRPAPAPIASEIQHRQTEVIPTVASAHDVSGLAAVPASTIADHCASGEECEGSSTSSGQA